VLEVERTAETNAKTAEEHQLLLDHVAAGDTDAAAAVMREHVDASLGAQAAWRLRKS
jgi:DNA-binding GntR family transcriptional regulator